MMAQVGIPPYKDRGVNNAIIVEAQSADELHGMLKKKVKAG